MKLEDQVVSLDLAKKLKELGVKQESEFCYFQNDWGCEHGEYKWDLNRCYGKLPSEDCVSAFTVAELGEMLPNTHFNFYKNADGYLFSHSIKGASVTDPSEANARAKMLIHLIEQGIVKP